MRFMSGLFRWGLILLGVYIGLGIFVFFFQSFILYHPDMSEFEECMGFQDYEMIEKDSTRMFYLDQSDSEFVVYYRGNAGSTCDRRDLGEFFESSGKSVVFVEYAGYAGDDRSPSSDLILDDVSNVVDFLEEYESGVVVGNSLGSSLAAYQSNISDNVDSLVLISSFTNSYDLAREMFPIYPVSLMLREVYETDSWISGFQGDVSFIHGAEDTVIDPRNSYELYESFQGDGEYHLIDGRGHNDLWMSTEFQDLVEDLVS